MSSARRRYWYWILIISVLLVCVVGPSMRYNSINKKLQKQVEAGQITEDQAKASYIQLGLDLAGGVDLLYQADPPPGSDTVTQDQMRGLVEIIRKRIDPEGIKETVVQQIGDTRLNVQVPGETDPKRIKELIDKTALLQFIDAKEVAWSEGDPVVVLKPGEEIPDELSSDTVDGEETTDVDIPGESDQPAEEESVGQREKTTRYITTEEIIVEGSMLKKASVGIGEYGGYQINIEFDKTGGRIFAEYTAHNVGRYLAIVLDGDVLSCPVINSMIPHGRGYISGNYTAQSAKELSTLLQSGSLPVPLTLLQSRAVGPSLGAESIDLSIKAMMIGLILLMIFMVFYYRLIGIMADLALIFYAFVFVGLLSAFGITLTLPGIAGFILSLGMAVDANVIIFERIKEELNYGKTYRAAIESGFVRAWPAILDANVTTLITGTVLYMMGSGTIKGFAVTLNLGILVSMFSALVVTRSLIYIWSGTKSLQKPFLFGYGVHGGKSE